MRDKSVSTVITTYNRDTKYVREAIESAVFQTYPPIEVIVVDDNGIGSRFENPLRNLCSKYDNVIYLPNEKNSGPQISRNNGISASKGEFVALLDDDDIWEKTKLEKQMALFTDERIGMVYCDGYSFEDGDMTKLSVFRALSVYERPITYEMELFNDWIGSTSQAVIRRSVFDDVGYFDVDMPARQDYEMWLRISRKYLIVGCSEKLLFYRSHSGVRISKDQKKIYLGYELILKKYGEDYLKNRYAKAKLILKMAKAAVKMKNPGLALKNFFNALFISPKCVFMVIIRYNTHDGSKKYDYMFDKIQVDRLK